MNIEESKEFFEYLCWEISKGMILFLILIVLIWVGMCLWQA